VLDLAGNRLGRLALYGARAVDVLRADDNLISDVDDEVFRATRDLHLANNLLRSLRTACDNDTTVGSFLFSTTEVSSPFVATQSGLATQAMSSSSSSSSVLVLDISGNRNLGPSLDTRKHSCNSLVSLDRLEILRARRVGIRRLPVRSIERLTSLRVLDVAHNEIGAVTASLSLSRLHELNLANNRLTNLSMLASALSWHGNGSFAERRSAVVNLAGNPWRCSCDGVPACRRLTELLDTRPSHHLHAHAAALRCASSESRSASQSVLEFCRDLVASAVDHTGTTVGCLAAASGDLEQRVVETAASRTLLFISVAIITVAVLASLACGRLWRRRNAGRRGRHIAAGSTRRHGGYRIVGETALDFSEVR